MKSFEWYETGKRSLDPETESMETLKINALQLGWAEFKCAHLTDEKERKRAEEQWIEELGQWFRTEIVESGERIDGERRKDFFFRLLDQDPTEAIRLLDELFRTKRH